jgi:hypothetical protein
MDKRILADGKFKSVKQLSKIFSVFYLFSDKENQFESNGY